MVLFNDMVWKKELRRKSYSATVLGKGVHYNFLKGASFATQTFELSFGPGKLSLTNVHFLKQILVNCIQSGQQRSFLHFSDLVQNISNKEQDHTQTAVGFYF